MDYNEKLRLAKEALESGSYDTETIEYIFPELKENTDERIKQALLEFFSAGAKNNETTCGIPDSKIVSWLEKQGEKPVNKLQVGDELYEHIRNTCACIDDAISSKTLADINDYLSMAERSANSAFDMIEKQGEHKETPCDKCKGEQPSHSCQDITELGRCYLEHEKQREQKPVTINNVQWAELTWEDINTLERIINNVHSEFRNGIGEESFGKEVLEKFRETKGDEYMDACGQKPADNVGPKFKAGDWIAGEVVHAAKIINIDDDEYEVEFIDGSKGFHSIDFMDKFYHLWTIDDAKDGDVLVSGGGCLFIYKNINDRLSLFYCCVSTDNDFLIGNDRSYCGPKKTAKPATKEQRDYLFQRMEEAGYKWDADKKELHAI